MNEFYECCDFIKTLSHYSSSFQHSVLYQKYCTVVNTFTQLSPQTTIAKLFFYVNHSDFYKQHSTYKQFALFVAYVLFQHKQVSNQEIKVCLRRITLTFTLIAKQTRNLILKQYYFFAAKVESNQRKIKNHFYRKHLISEGKQKPILKIMKERKIKFVQKYERAVELQKIMHKHRKKFTKNKENKKEN